jgi:phosphohistidine phosphatase
MKRLLVLRHAKAEPRESAEEDVSRLLAESGRKDARELGRLLRKRAVLPELILTSGAARARETASGVAAELASSPPIRESPGLYASDVQGYLRELAGLPEEASCVLLVGHNPAAEGLATLLAGRAVELKTCWLAELQVGVREWKDLLESPRSRLEAVLSPDGERSAP